MVERLASHHHVYLCACAVDWESCDEDEEFQGACRHCFSQQSEGGWHHGGPNKAILCHSCQLHFQRYGSLGPNQEDKEPPEFMFK